MCPRPRQGVRSEGGTHCRTPSLPEPVPLAPYGLHVHGLGRDVFQLLPDAADVDGHSQGLACVFLAPHGQRQLFAREDAAGIRRQNGQDVELLGSEPTRARRASSPCACAGRCEALRIPPRRLAARRPCAAGGADALRCAWQARRFRRASPGNRRRLRRTPRPWSTMSPLAERKITGSVAPRLAQPPAHLEAVQTGHHHVQG